ncbi:MAG: rhodanese-like domain-containing protein [Gammaproteobacteria bacterium]|nr:MAG: rhodanese-like domain-containing protein [Gammaproteobacteria bacterium]
MARLIEFTNNHPLLVAGTVLMALAVIFYELRQRGRGLFELSPAQAVLLINKGAKVCDLREQDAWAKGHIVDAERVDAERLDEIAQRQAKKKRALLLVCDNGITSAREAERLRKQGHEQVFSLRGGMTAWLRDNLPVVSG